MLQLLNPIWLFAIGGIVIPLIIHLWNIKKGKTLKVGSISLLGESSRQSAKSLKLIDLLLLFLRCLLTDPPADFAVQGRDLMTGVPKQITVSYTEIAHCLDKSISKIEEAILKALEMTPPELSADIYQTGIYLTGGGALLRGLDKRISSKTKLPVHVAEDPLRAVVRGTGIALKNIGNFKFLMQ